MTHEMAEVHKLDTSKKRGRGNLITWNEFEPLLSQLRQLLNCNNEEAMQHVGYAGGTHVATWRKSNEVPILAKNAICWLIQECRATPKVKESIGFSHVELSHIFAALNNITISEEQRKKLINKTARCMVAL